MPAEVLVLNINVAHLLSVRFTVTSPSYGHVTPDTSLTFLTPPSPKVQNATKEIYSYKKGTTFYRTVAEFKFLL